VEVTLGANAVSMSPDRFIGKVGLGEEQMPSEEKHNNSFLLFVAMSIETSLNNLPVYVRPHNSGAFGGDLAADWTREVMIGLRAVKLKVSATAAAGDRSDVPGQTDAFARHEFVVIEMMHHVAVIGSEHRNISLGQTDLGERALICDVLPTLKCERCRLSDLLSFHAWAPTISAKSLNKLLPFRGSLAEPSSISKINEVLMVDFFTVETLGEPSENPHKVGFYYLAPFVFLVRIHEHRRF
jgi:hypothetical protein